MTRAQFNAMQKEVARLKEENEILKIAAVFAGRTSQVTRKTHFPIVQSLLKQHFKLMMVLRLLKIPKSTYFDWVHYTESQRQRERHDLKSFVA